MQEYQYPLDLDWTTDEMVIVMKMWEDLERANEKGINNEAFLKTYQQFNRIRQKSPILYRWVMNAVRYEGYR
ncbi:UPF0223 family protein, partial [Enterococcus faecium]|nr:UPF0223 family protein [Enterococcus faecium]